MRWSIVKHKWLTIAILIALLISIFSIMMIMLTGFGTSSDQTPTGAITSVTVSPDDKTRIGFGVVTPITRYRDCEVILVPPGDSGIGSSAQAKLWKIGQSTGFAYNSTIYIELSPPDTNEPVGGSLDQGNNNDSLVINCSSGKIPEGKWMIFLIFAPSAGGICDAVWYVNETPLANHSLTFSNANTNAMEYYGFYHPPWNVDWYFWSTLLTISFVCFVFLILYLVAITIHDRKRR